MQQDKPLHVQFAEACLGWTECHNVFSAKTGPAGAWHWVGVKPGDCEYSYTHIPSFDKDGYDLGPWEEANQIEVSYGLDPDQPTWSANRAGPREEYMFADARRRAVLCCLIALFKAGKGMRP